MPVEDLPATHVPDQGLIAVIEGPETVIRERIVIGTTWGEIDVIRRGVATIEIVLSKGTAGTDEIAIASEIVEIVIGIGIETATDGIDVIVSDRKIQQTENAASAPAHP
ncbi:unnamed protein product [Sphagnum balticum]